MPEKGKLPEWEREDNRTKIFLMVLEKPLTFTELRRETGFSKSTLSQHLKDLQKSRVVEKVVKNGKVVYQAVLNEEKLKSEFIKLSFIAAVELISKLNPHAAERFVQNLDDTFKDFIEAFKVARKKFLEG